MKLGSIREVASRAEHLQGEQREIENELANAERQSDAAARQYSALVSQLRSLPDDADASMRASIESQISQATAEWRNAQASLAQAEARQEALNREINDVTGDAQEYLRSIEGNIEAAQGAASSSQYGASAISQLVAGFRQNKGMAERVLQMFDRSGSAGAAGLLGAASGQGIVGKGIQLGNGDESVLHIHGNEMYRHVDFLDRTRQGVQTYTIDGEVRTCFDSPETTGRSLNYNQGTALLGFQGTCGVVSCENVALLAGKQLSEVDVITVATNHGLCTVKGGDSMSSGGTTPQSRQEILAAIGIDSHLETDTNVENIAREVESGRGVIASVDAGLFWNDANYSGGHAITVTSVERNPYGDVTAFYVCDSGSGGVDFARRIDVGWFSQSLIPGRELNVTDGIIR